MSEQQVQRSWTVPCYPDFIPLDVELKDSLHPRLSLTADGVSEFSFSGLYLFRNRYNYRVSRNGQNGGFIISGEQPSHGNNCAGMPAQVKKFFMTPCEAPNQETLDSLFASHDYWKNISETVLSPVREKIEQSGIVITEDRDNFDYLYYRQELAELAGKKFHKKKNHVKNFLSAYPDHEQKPMSGDLVPAAIEILERWRQDRGEGSLSSREDSASSQLPSGEDSASDGDYKAAREALDLFDSLTLRGSIFFVGGKPAAYCLGESIARGRMFAIHFEKAIDEYRGLYQFVNQAFAESLPRFFTLINREQDLGSEGLRQAKMTYRPCGFVKKYIGTKI